MAERVRIKKELEPGDMIISLGDEIISARCACGHWIGEINPDGEISWFETEWERHVQDKHPNYPDLEW